MDNHNIKNRLAWTYLVGILSIGCLSPPILATEEATEWQEEPVSVAIEEVAEAHISTSEEVIEEEVDLFSELLAELNNSSTSPIKFSIPNYSPDSEVIYELKDSTLMIHKFTVPSDVDPADLLREPFECLGYRYEFQSIEREQLLNTEVKEFEEQVSIELRVTSKQAAYEAFLPMLEPTIEYEDEDGIFKGELKLDADSITFNVLNARTTSSSQTTTRTYTSAYNDDSIIPQTITADGATWYLKSRTWSSGSNLSDSSLPSSYTATAVYSRSVSYGVNDGYTATVTYRGLLTAEESGDMCYELSYIGTPVGAINEDSDESTVGVVTTSPTTQKTSVLGAVGDFFSGIPEFFKSLTGTEGGEEAVGSKLSNSVAKLGYFAVSVLLTIVSFLFLGKLIKAIAENRSQRGGKAVISARDDFSGVETRIQKVRITTKKPVITINYAKVPQATHFTVTLKPEVAELFTGRRITINIGKEVRTHLVGQAHNNNYVIPVEWSG